MVGECEVEMRNEGQECSIHLQRGTAQSHIHNTFSTLTCLFQGTLQHSDYAHAYIYLQSDTLPHFPAFLRLTRILTLKASHMSVTSFNIRPRKTAEKC